MSTLEENYGWITLDDTKLAKMDEDRDVGIRKKGKQLELYVRSGSLFFNVTEPLAVDESMDIRTSTMAVGIRGTCGWVEVENKNPAACRTRNPAGSMDMSRCRMSLNGIENIRNPL